MIKSSISEYRVGNKVILKAEGDSATRTVIEVIDPKCQLRVGDSVNDFSSNKDYLDNIYNGNFVITSSRRIKSNYYRIHYDDYYLPAGRIKDSVVIRASDEKSARDKFNKHCHYGATIDKVIECDEFGNDLIKSAYTRKDKANLIHNLRINSSHKPIQSASDKNFVITSSRQIKSSRRIKSALDTWVDPRSKVKGWKVKVLDVYPDDYAGATTAKVELFDPEGNSQGEENIYIHRQDVKIGETYDACIDGLMAMPRIIGVSNISYDEVPSMKNVTRERYLKSAYTREDYDRFDEYGKVIKSSKSVISVPNEIQNEYFEIEGRIDRAWNSGKLPFCDYDYLKAELDKAVTKYKFFSRYNNLYHVLEGRNDFWDRLNSFESIKSSRQIKFGWERTDMASGPIWDKDNWRIIERRGHFADEDEKWYVLRDKSHLYKDDIRFDTLAKAMDYVDFRANLNSSRQIKSSWKQFIKGLDKLEKRDELKDMYNQAHWEFLDYIMPCDPEWTEDLNNSDFNPLDEIHFLFKSPSDIEEFLFECAKENLPGAKEKLRRIRQINACNKIDNPNQSFIQSAVNEINEEDPVEVLLKDAAEHFGATYKEGWYGKGIQEGDGDWSGGRWAVLVDENNSLDKIPIIHFIAAKGSTGVTPMNAKTAEGEQFPEDLIYWIENKIREDEEDKGDWHDQVVVFKEADVEGIDYIDSNPSTRTVYIKTATKSDDEAEDIAQKFVEITGNENYEIYDFYETSEDSYDDLDSDIRDEKVIIFSL